MTIQQTMSGCIEARCDDCGTQVIGATVKAMLTETSVLGWHFDRNAIPIAHYCPQCCLKMAGPASDADLVAFTMTVLPGGFVVRSQDASKPEHESDPDSEPDSDREPEPDSDREPVKPPASTIVEELVAAGIKPLQPKLASSKLAELDDLERTLDELDDFEPLINVGTRGKG